MKKWTLDELQTKVENAKNEYLSTLNSLLFSLNTEYNLNATDMTFEQVADIEAKIEAVEAELKNIK